MIILIGDRIVSMVVEQEKHQVCGGEGTVAEVTNSLLLVV